MSATFWVTTNCNLNCKYCYEGEDKLDIYMSKDVVEQTINFMLNNLNNLDVDNITIPIHGGEPFLEFETIKYIVERCKDTFKDKKVSFVTTTNGTILNDEILEFIINEMPGITLSIDGRKETHNKMRPFKNGAGSHSIVMENGLKILKYLPNMRVRMTFDSTSVHDLHEDIRFLIDNGFRVIVPALDLYDKKWNESHIDILENQMLQIKKYIKNKEAVTVSILDKNAYSIKGRCNGGKMSFHIYPNGKLYPCVLVAGMSEFEIGNIYDGIDVKKRDEILSHSRKVNKGCDGCKLYNYCDGPRCKIVNKLTMDNYYSSPPIHCAMENLKYKINFY